MADTAVLRIRVESSGISKAGADLTQLSKQGLSVENTMGRLRSAVLSVGSAIGANAVIQYADAWTGVSNKLANVTKEGETLVDVQNRVFSIAQRSNSSLEATATLYSRLEPATRGLVNSGSALGSVVETINKAMIVSGATSAEAAGSLVQLAQGLGAGALRGEEFNSVNEAAPRLMQALADSLGVTRGELKNYATQGKLTSEVVITAMRSQASAIDAEFSKMNKTFEQKGVLAFNNLVKAIGENSTLTSSVGAAGDALVSLSEHIDLVVKAGEVLAVTYSARLVGAITSGIQAKLTDITTSMELASANLTAAQAATVQAAAEKESAIAAQQSLVSQLALAQSERTRTAIRQQLAVNSAAVASATNAEAAAMTRLTAATNAANITQRAAGGALALIGGPAGLAMLAGTAIYYLVDAYNAGKQSSIDFANSVDTSTEALKKLTPAALDAAKFNLEESIANQTSAFEEQQNKVKNLQAELNKYSYWTEEQKSKSSALRDLQGELANETANLEKQEAQLNNSKHKLNVVIATINGTMRQNYVLMGQSNKVTGIAASIQAELNRVLNIGNQALEKRNNYVATAQSIFTDKDKQALQGLQQQINLEKVQGEQRVRLKAQYEAEQKGLSGPGIKEYVNQAVILNQLEQANEKKTRTEQKAISSVKQLTNANDELNQKLGDLRTELDAATLRYQGNEEAAIKLETAHELGARAATKEGQQIQLLTVQLYRLKQAQEAAAQKTEDRNYLDGVLAGNDPTKQENNRYKQEQDELKRHAANKNYTQQEIDQAEIAMAKTHKENLKKIEQDKVDEINQTNQQMLGDASTIFDGLAGIAKAYGGEQSASYRALFAISKAFSIAQATMSIATGLGKAQELGWPANLGAMANVAATGASIMSTISGANFSGAYDKGGYIPAGAYGIVAENGNELVNGTLIHGPANVTSRKETAALLKNSNNNNGNTSINKSTNVTVNQTIMTTGKIDTRTSKQIASDTARKQRMVTSRLG